MSDEQQSTRIAGQVLSIIEKLASNPQGKLTAENIGDAFATVTNAVDTLYARTSSLTNATAAQPRTAPVSAPAVSQETAPAAKQAASASAPAAVAPAQPQAVAKVETQEEEHPAQAAPEVKAAAPAPAAAPVKQAARQSTKQAAKKVASDTVRSAQPRVNGRFVKKTAEVAVAPETAPEPTPAPVLDEEAEDQKMVSQMIAEHGSAKAAVEQLETKRGRKPGWHKMLERMAKEEIRLAPSQQVKAKSTRAIAAAIAAGRPKEEVRLEHQGYKFADISRTPFKNLDPEKAASGMKMVCLIDGVARTMMSRYLEAKHHMTPEEYIAHFNLRDDYPMTANAYREEKRRLAGVQKLGKRKTAEAEAVEAPAATPAIAETPKTVSTNRRKRDRASVAA